MRAVTPGPFVTPASTNYLQFEFCRSLNYFPDISQQEVEDIIRRMKPSTCALDPLPTALVKSNISAISPLITTVINLSLQDGYIPHALKTSIIKHPQKTHTGSRCFCKLQAHF